MNRKILIAAGVAALLVGVVVIARNLGTPANRSQAASEATVPPRPRHDASDSAFQDDLAPKISSRAGTEPDQAELVAQYGESRTRLARHVSENVVGLLDDVIAMGEIMLTSQTGEFGGRNGLRWALRNSGVELTEEQKEQAAQLLSDQRRRELEKTKASVSQLRKDPTPLMSMLLAGDARSRDELSEEQYAALQLANSAALGSVINPLDRSNYGGGSPMKDEQFRNEFKALLDQEQAVAFEESMAGSDEQVPAGPMRTDFTQIPVMDLEAADEAIRSTRQMTGGFKQVVEGMGNLGPLLEQQRQNRRGGE